MKLMTLALLGVMTACSSTTTNQPQATASGVGSPRADFAKYQTFAFGPANPPAEGYMTTARSLEVERRLSSLVDSTLQGRGYKPSTGQADLLIKVSTGSGTLAGDKVQRGNPEADVPAGFIGVDAYDSATGASIWHGYAFAEIDPNHINDSLLAQGVEKMLATFPSRAQ